jgi:hypothetical protein
MTLHPIPLNSLYMRKNFIYFISARVLKEGACDEHFLTFLILGNMKILCVFLTMLFQEEKPSGRMCVLYVYFCLLNTFCSSTYCTHTNQTCFFLVHNLVFSRPLNLYLLLCLLCLYPSEIVHTHFTKFTVQSK